MPSGRFRGFLKRTGHSVKNVFKSSDRANTSSTPSVPLAPSRDPHVQPTPSPEQVLAQSAQPPTQSQQTPGPTQTESILSEPAPATLPSSGNGGQPANPESSLIVAAKKAGKDAWSGLKTALRLLEKSSDVFPPLKSAVGGFLGMVDIFESAAENQKNYAALASNLREMVDEFQMHPGEQTSSNMSDALKAMANELLEHVKEHQERSGTKRHIEAGQDAADVQECNRRVENLRRALQHKELVGMLNNQSDTLDKIRGKQEDQVGNARLKELNATLKALYDSTLADVVGRRTCTPDTRRAVLEGMRKWADDPTSPKVYWLNGMAGTGKTTLAYSFCDEMQRARRLGASFFCSRADAESREVSRIVPTIAHQLALLLPSYREALVRQIGEDTEICARRTETQFEKLIRDPLREVEASVPSGIVVTIDALDESDRRDGAQDILNVLFLHARDLPIKFLVTCRPEPGLFDVLQSKDGHDRSVLHLHDIEASFVQADIAVFLKAELASLALPQEKIEQLAKQAETLFIYAATAARYIHPKGRPVNFRQRLADVLSMGSKTDTNKHAAINDLYTAVLSTPFADKDLNPSEKQTIRLVLDTAVCAKEPMSVRTMTRLLGLKDEQDVIYAAQHLLSVLHLSEGTGLISTFHASFPDFMLNRRRSADLCCNVTEHHRSLALGCFSTMQLLLRFNICELESSFVLDASVSNLGRRIENSVSPELFYACRYWGDHLGSAESRGDAQHALDDFLANRLLFWMEVLNLRKCIAAGAQMLTQVHRWLQKSGSANDIAGLALDAGRFVTAFSLSSASGSTPHIYVSALPFWPETRPVRQRYWKRTQGLVKLEGTGIEGRNLACLAIWSANSAVTCVAQSPDGTRIVSGSGDYTIRAWDARTGLLVAGPFKGHTELVDSVRFSPDGTRFVSGSGDYTIRVWDAHTGFLVAEPFEGHTDGVSSVAFSSDDTRIVSGSLDKTIRVWDAHTGLLAAGPFEGHTSYVSSVAFSPDGIHIVSGSWDKTIRVWDAHTGLLAAGPFVGHTSFVRSVGFSPDGTRIVSGSSDESIRVWDAHTGLLAAGPFEGHTGYVSSVAFSPDGIHIVSGSLDKTIRVWDAHTGLLVAGPFEGHTSCVKSVGFSSDGTRIVSGSYDKTIRVWDVHTGLLAAGPFEEHTREVSSVIFSHDGTRIVSGSLDKTIRVWDAHTGLLAAGPFEGHTSCVTSVGLSPDGTRIVSGSGDDTICVWDAHTGRLAAGPFEGRTSWVTSVAFSHDGTQIVSGSYDKTICVRDAHTGLLVAGPFEGHTREVTSVGLSPDGTRIVSGSWDTTVRVWDAHTGLLAAGPFEGHTGWVTSVGFSPDGTRIVSGSYDDTICVWDAYTGLLAAGPFEGHSSFVRSVGFSPDGTRIVSGSRDKTIRVWDSHSGLLVAGPFEGHTSWVTSVGFSPDGRRIVSGSHDKTICVWDAHTGLLVAGPFQGHTDEVSSVVFLPNGTHIVSGAHDNTIRVWDTTPHVHDPGHFTDWRVDASGMITTRQGELLLCVPVDLLTGLVQPQNTVCICAKGVLKLNFDHVLLGNQWTNCYDC